MVSVSEILKDAKKNQYGVGAFNVTSLLYVDAIVAAAEKCKSPLIISASEHHFKKGFLDIEALSNYVKEKSKKNTVPIALHLDHGESFECIEKAVACGFTSVMLDRSQCAYDENVRDTSRVVEYCRNLGVSVEGELGMIGGKEGDGHINTANKDFFTNPDFAYDYVSKTGIDSLAVAIGNVHGRYLGEPKLDFNRLLKIKEKVDVPLVLHGGSGITADDFKKLISYGINKINYYSGNAQATYASLDSFFKKKPSENGVDIGYLFSTIYDAVLANTVQQMENFGSSYKA